MAESFRPPRRSRRCTRYRIGCVSLYLHHQAWWIYYREGGQPVRRRLGQDYEAAARVAVEVHAQLASARPTCLTFTPISLAELQQAFLRYHEQVQRSSLATIARYRTATQHLVDFAAQVGPQRPAHELSVTQFVTFLRSREVTPNGHPHATKRRLRDQGVQYILEVCRSLYGFAQRQRHLPPYAGNPFAELRIERMRCDDAKPVFVFDAHTEGLFLQAAHAWEFPIQFTLAKTGLRPGELCHLLIEDVDLSQGWLAIRNKPELGWAVKTRNERAVPLLPELTAVLSVVIADRPAGVLFRRPRYVAPDSQLDRGNRASLAQRLQAQLHEQEQRLGRRLDRTDQQRLARQFWQAAGAFDPDQIRRSFLRIARRAGMPHASCPKSWRHTVATLLQDANVDPLLRQITLGHQPSGAHAALGMTTVYTHSRPETQAREIRRALSLWPSTLELARTWAVQGCVPCHK
ncbi:tyrosine-type recombinase/integrase [bacterium]|nr:tyrosine-type recombinase/integrase [bacterium]